MVNAGADLELLLLLTVSDINDLPNAPRAASLVPKVPENNETFVRGIRLLSSLVDRQAVELAIATEDDAEGSSDPLPRSRVQARDLLNAYKDGYVYRTRGEGQVTLLKREKELILRVFPRYVNSPEMEEVTRIFHLTPGLSRYRIKSELTSGGGQSLPNALGDDTIYLNMRSVLQVMTFLSKGVCVPEDHVQSGIAPVTRGPDGRLYSWLGVTAGHFTVHAQKHRPRIAEVAVQYRDYWFFIAIDDVNSRAVLAVLELLFALQESDTKNAGPLLTLPVGG